MFGVGQREKVTQRGGGEQELSKGEEGPSLPRENGIKAPCVLKLPSASRKWPGWKASGFSKWHGSWRTELRMGYTVVSYESVKAKSTQMGVNKEWLNQLGYIHN